MGTRCESVEAYLAKEKRGKKVVYILNKVDLVPGWVAVSLSPRWVPLLVVSLFVFPSPLLYPMTVRLPAPFSEELIMRYHRYVRGRLTAHATDPSQGPLSFRVELWNGRSRPGVRLGVFVRRTEIVALLR